LRFAFQTYQLKNSYAQRGEQAFNDRKENLLNSFKSQYRNYSSQVDKDVFEVLIALYAKEVPSQFLPKSFKDINVSKLTNDVYGKSAFANYESVEKLLTGDAKTVIGRLEKDPGFKIAAEMADAYFDKVAPD